MPVGFAGSPLVLSWIPASLSPGLACPISQFQVFAEPQCPSTPSSHHAAWAPDLQSYLKSRPTSHRKQGPPSPWMARHLLKQTKASLSPHLIYQVWFPSQASEEPGLGGGVGWDWPWAPRRNTAGELKVRIWGAVGGLALGPGGEAGPPAWISLTHPGQEHKQSSQTVCLSISKLQITLTKYGLTMFSSYLGAYIFVTRRNARFGFRRFTVPKVPSLNRTAEEGPQLVGAPGPVFSPLPAFTP